jgi:hypothetical protein
MLTLAGGLVFAAGTLATGAGGIDLIKAWGDTGWSMNGSSAYKLVSNYEDTATELGRTGQESQLAEQFNPQQVADAYKQLDAENNRNLSDVAFIGSGFIASMAGVIVVFHRRKG